MKKQMLILGLSLLCSEIFAGKDENENAAYLFWKKRQSIPKNSTIATLRDVKIIYTKKELEGKFPGLRLTNVDFLNYIERMQIPSYKENERVRLENILQKKKEELSNLSFDNKNLQSDIWHLEKLLENDTFVSTMSIKFPYDILS